MKDFEVMIVELIEEWLRSDLMIEFVGIGLFCCEFGLLMMIIVWELRVVCLFKVLSEFGF